MKSLILARGERRAGGGGCINVGDLFDLKHFANSKTLWLPVEFTADNHMLLKKRDLF